MKVETFEDEEVAREHPEVTDEAMRLIESLGLDGQRELVAPKTEEAPDPNRNPYRKMTKEERFVYGVLCPDKADIGRYSRSAIPLRVLQVAEHARAYFKELKVWDKQDGSIKDPVLVGYSDSHGAHFLLARWGEELDTFSVLRDKALSIQRDAVLSRVRDLIHEAKSVEANINTLPMSKMQDYWGDPTTSVVS